MLTSRISQINRLIDEADHHYACEHKSVKALPKINRALDLDSDPVEALVLKGRILFQRGRLREMRQCYDRALQINPKCSEVFVERARVFYTIKQDYRAALGEIQKALQYAGRSRWVGSLAWRLKGGILADLNKDQRALRCYRTALRFNPKDESAHFSLANVLLAMANPQLAISHIDKALKLLRSQESPKESALELAIGTKAEALNAFHKHQDALQLINKGMGMLKGRAPYLKSLQIQTRRLVGGKT